MTVPFLMAAHKAGLSAKRKSWRKNIMEAVVFDMQPKTLFHSIAHYSSANS